MLLSLAPCFRMLSEESSLKRDEDEVENLLFTSSKNYQTTQTQINLSI